ncbi:hypothetical protein Scep_002361 [Stephania cephalantha]|uniref:Uncharacterized protein n=1 Tax=Stephania cephalantha TaxID=152367 RepID=A0AAP0Q4K3_9MAGN
MHLTGPLWIRFIKWVVKPAILLRRRLTYFSGAKPEETLVEARSDTDVQIVRLTWDDMAASLSLAKESKAPSGPFLNIGQKKELINLTRPISSHRDVLNEAAIMMTCEKLVVPGNCPPNLVPGLTSDTPWSASDHHSYPLMPSRGTAAALSINRLIFSCNVSRPIRSLTRIAICSDALQNVRFLKVASCGSQANGGWLATAQTRRRGRRRRGEDNIG